MSERDMRKRVVRALRPLDAISVENRCGLGTPDINYVEGWIECKWLRKWPKHPTTLVRLTHELMPQQRVWLSRRRRRGGVAWVLLQCGQEWFLIDGVVAGRILGYATRAEIIEMSHYYWPDGLVDDELVEALRAANA